MHQLGSRDPALSLALLTERMSGSVPIPKPPPLRGGVKPMPGRPGGVVALLSSFPAAVGVSLARSPRHENHLQKIKRAALGSGLHPGVKVANARRGLSAQ